MAFSILQWNCRSIFNKLPEFKYYLSSLQELPDFICLQETFLSTKYNPHISGYSLVRKDRPLAQGKGGGICMFIKTGINYNELYDFEDIDGNEEIMAIEVNGITLVNLYNKPNNHLSINTLNALSKFKKVLVVGDFNAHHPMWGSSRLNYSGSVLADWLRSTDYIMLNTSKPTYISDSNPHSWSLLDLSIASPNLANCCNTIVTADYNGSDHCIVLTHIKGNIRLNKTFIPRWSINRANWDAFKTLCGTRLNNSLFTGCIDKCVENISESIISAATESIPKTKPSAKPSVPWWNKSCTSAVKARNHAFHRMRRITTPENVFIYKRKKAEARKTIHEAKINSWQEYCNSLNNNSKLTQVWKTLKRFSGRSNNFGVSVLYENNKIAKSDHEKADLLAKQFYSVSSTNNFQQEFLQRKHIITNLCAKSISSTRNLDPRLNMPLTANEFGACLRYTKNTAPGGDQICYEMLKHLSDSSINVIIKLFNRIWFSGEFPSLWRHSIVIPIHKNGKPIQHPLSYRPISLTSNLCKTMEKIVAKRLTWYLEHNNLIHLSQSGFRHRRRSTDNLIRLHDTIYKALANDRSVMAVFLDIEKAYDMVYKDALLLKLLRLGINGPIFNFIKSFITNRTFQVRVSSSYSEVNNLENGIPQGSILSPILFSIMINDLPECLDCPTALYADDFCFFQVGRDISELQNNMKKNLHKVFVWCQDWGFKISTTKSAALLFSKRKKLPKLCLEINSFTIPFKNEYKYLGVLFQSNGSYINHVKNIVHKCEKRLNILRSIKGTSWGASKLPMIALYRALIRSVTDYAQEVYFSKDVQRYIEQIQNQALRLCTGAMKSTPIVCLQHSCNELPPQLRYEQLCLNYKAHLLTFKSHPAHTVISDSWYNWYPNNLNYKSFHMFTDHFFTDFLDTNSFPSSIISNILLTPILPYWTLAPFHLDLFLLNHACLNSNAVSVQQLFLEHIHNNYNDFLLIYTDGSKSTLGTSSSFYVHRFDFKQVTKLTKFSSVFTAELFAILQTLYWISTKRYKKNVIITDSLSSLQAISHCTFGKNVLVNKILMLHSFLVKSGLEISFIWVPSHSGIYGNEMADKLAKLETSNSPPNAFGQIARKQIDVSINFLEMKSIIKNYVYTLWDKLYKSSVTGSFYKFIFPSVFVSSSSCSPIFFRLRTGHCKLKYHLSRLQIYPSGVCPFCPALEDVPHYLLNCKKHTKFRNILRNQLANHDLTLTISSVLSDLAESFVIEYVKNTGYSL